MEQTTARRRKRWDSGKRERTEAAKKRVAIHTMHVRIIREGESCMARQAP